MAPLFGWLSGGLALAAMTASLRRGRRTLGLHLLLASWQSAALAFVGGCVGPYLSLCDGHGGGPVNEVLRNLLLPFLAPATAAPLVLPAGRRFLPRLFPSPAFSGAVSVLGALLAGLGTFLVLSTPYRTWPTPSLLLSLFF